MSKLKRGRAKGVIQILQIVVASMAFTSPAYAYHPLVTDDTGTQGMGGNQLELGYDYARSGDFDEASNERAVPITYTRGLTDRLDVFAGAARQTTPKDGWGTVGIGAKWRFYENETCNFSVAVRPEILLPVSRDKEAAGFGNGKTSYGVTLIMTRATNFGELHFNLAADRSNFADTIAFPDRKNIYRVSAAPVWTVAARWKLALDVGMQTNPDPDEKSRMGYVELGVVFSSSEDLGLSFGITRDLLDGADSVTYASFGLTWRFR